MSKKVIRPLMWELAKQFLQVIFSNDAFHKHDTNRFGKNKVHHHHHHKTNPLQVDVRNEIKDTTDVPRAATAQAEAPATNASQKNNAKPSTPKRIKKIIAKPEILTQNQSEEYASPLKSFEECILFANDNAEELPASSIKRRMRVTQKAMNTNNVMSEISEPKATAKVNTRTKKSTLLRDSSESALTTPTKALTANLEANTAANAEPLDKPRKKTPRTRKSTPKLALESSQNEQEIDPALA